MARMEKRRNKAGGVRVGWGRQGRGGSNHRRLYVVDTPGTHIFLRYARTQQIHTHGTRIQTTHSRVEVERVLVEVVHVDAGDGAEHAVHAAQGVAGFLLFVVCFWVFCFFLGGSEDRWVLGK